ncbi:unnamed protein product [Amoebophrya sp. A120]|nr:unnamed protein product [Amoebophrya sp. A120]|eukprot:GSA120T00009919001.1
MQLLKFCLAVPVGLEEQEPGSEEEPSRTPEVREIVAEACYESGFLDYESDSQGMCKTGLCKAQKVKVDLYVRTVCGDIGSRTGEAEDADACMEDKVRPKYLGSGSDEERRPSDIFKYYFSVGRICQWYEEEAACVPNWIVEEDGKKYDLYLTGDREKITIDSKRAFSLQEDEEVNALYEGLKDVCAANAAGDVEEDAEVQGVVNTARARIGLIDV